MIVLRTEYAAIEDNRTVLQVEVIGADPINCTKVVERVPPAQRDLIIASEVEHRAARYGENVDASE